MSGLVASLVILLPGAGLAAVPAVRISDPVLPGDMAETDASGLVEALRVGMQRAEIEVAAAGDAPWVELHVTKDDSDYGVVITVKSADRGEVIAEASESCELCGLAELQETVIAVTSRLRQRLDLAGDEGRLLVSTDPAGAIVRIDGEVVGTTPLEADLASGQHEIIVEKRGFKTESTPFASRAGAESRFTYAMRPRRYRQWVPWTSLGVGAALVGTGIALLVIDGDPIANQCNADTLGNCEFLHDTLPGGVGATVAGGALMATGVVLAVVWRKRRSDRGRRARATSMGFQLVF